MSAHAQVKLNAAIIQSPIARALLHWLHTWLEASPLSRTDGIIWQAGYDAYETGLARTACPHMSPIMRAAWQAGHDDAQAAFLRGW